MNRLSRPCMRPPGRSTSWSSPWPLWLLAVAGVVVVVVFSGASNAYQITYRLNSTNSNTATVDVLSPSARQYAAGGLRAEMVYVFRLTAQTRKGWGEAAEALV
ncbi:hypothetical protein CRUP_023080, partial [Coryphaenoides rupestris]